MGEGGTPQENDLRNEVSRLAGRMRSAATMFGSLLENVRPDMGPEGVENFTARARVLLNGLDGYIKALEDLGKG